MQWFFCQRSSHYLAACHVFGVKTTPAPLIFQRIMTLGLDILSGQNVTSDINTAEIKQFLENTDQTEDEYK